MKKLLVTDKINFDALQPLKKIFKIEILTGLTPEDLQKIIKKYYCLITRSATALPEKLLAEAGNLKIIARAGIGVDNIDIFTATRKKIAVLNAPKGNAQATAEHTIGLLFSLLRHIPQAHADLKEGLWNKQKYVGSQISGKTLGIVGFGNVGREVYRLAKGIGMHVVVCEPYTGLPENIRHVTYEQLLKESDVISFHVPMTYLTENMLNRYTLSFCKNGVYIINCSRGLVINDNAVIEGLKNGKIAGLAVDVFSKEPPVDKRILEFSTCVATPHIAGSTVESQKQSVSEIVTGIVSLINDKAPANLLNPQVFVKRKPVKKLSLEFDSIIFDCDSTLSSIEGIDELAEFYKLKKEISLLTKNAMEGISKFEEVFHKRLALLKPSRNNMEKLGDLYVQNLAEDAREVIEALQYLNKKVYIVSGSYTPAVIKLSNELKIPSKNVFANDIIFDDKGYFLRHIEGPLKRNHGKLQIVRRIPGKKIMIGDGITDLEAKNLVDLFVGFGGFKVRSVVEAESDVYLYNSGLSSALVISIGIKGAISLLNTKYRRLVGKGIDLLTHPKYTRIKENRRSIITDLQELAYL
ncbi:hypothetical protein A3D05_02945 [Candidatus Gottesmanbacteria bacterium RIFCSPHIGHO2_02_FULL_40_24]|uniref:D-3-phosphoglycerate dehydrogenase n=1 Tax=Candidatus Gottesmanbacteria bacterium RIFCSPHIGHO2_01_FULL_40_15 TaxID=1798376 RepID=A0A1F5YZR4_9BACT|nr:MAG: hypothetical protein A2777_00455 [Candidatus Gottesmanbacteria bacterium RIFCSPHIGHO2_01_FULL_40_15]OGG17462.1 MAG: hypothetical protein A3D05_02945 [Candidatus Gottesmanbacteria bacterium RIFCSPHIGHO2_02_FULL_40_24]OGG20959.1 MAG: hypothetical protein A3B48_00790 [Candidatus Gottesmanbacteria bacterium RIFCSPLOWO2_01_FULL_40_10]OGG25090.1 MAG: hypothetical protein A3E42_00785 [Candidatus Gottesmanbacteria bacterium RIFCSPHIGHO2_12_FULL_40_13]OGG32081.1 MAG: hypothetical protein A3I80_0